MKEINIDRPITGKAGDVFSRSEFAKQIAKFCQSNTPTSTTIGIYGKWGEGKTSLINMVSEELSADVIQIKFNPWLFKDDEDLLQEFFRLFALSMHKRLVPRYKRIVKLIADYSDSLMILDVAKTSGLSTIIKGITKLFKAPSKQSIEAAKKRINNFIIDSQLNIVIYIDDIDRLDKREVTTVFKLVKLLGDFPRTTYILAFDPDLVAQMIAPEFGGMDSEKGHDFLEKIIQLPLILPKPQEKNLFDFIRLAIGRNTADNDLVQNSFRMDEIFSDGLSVLLNSPRKAIRFENSFAFSLQILRGEVNFVDLLIIEAIKVSFHSYFQFIRNNKYFFLTDYLDPEIKPKGDEIEEAVRKAEEAIKEYPDDVKQAIRNFTCHLFPNFIWNKNEIASFYLEDQLIITRRICTVDYFDRYFTFSLRPEEIPDTYFSEHYLELKEKKIDEIRELLHKDFEKYTTEAVARKIAQHRSEFSITVIDRLLPAIAQESNSFTGNIPLNWGSSFSLMIIAILGMLKKIEGNRKLSMAKEIIETTPSLDFAAELTARLVMPKSENDRLKIFDVRAAFDLKSAYISRLKKKIAETGFFNAIDEAQMARQLVWWSDIDQNGLQYELIRLLDQDSEAPLKILRIFTPTIITSTTNAQNRFRSFKTDFTQREFNIVDKIVGANFLYSKLTAIYGDKSFNDGVRDFAYQEEVSDSILIGKFQWLYGMNKGLFEDGKPMD